MENIVEDIVHCSLEGRRCIRQLEGHNKKFVMDVNGQKCSFEGVGLVKLNLVVARTKVYFGENG